jgi:hypothetical protein
MSESSVNDSGFFYSGEYVCRTWNGAMSAIVPLLFAGFFGFITATIFSEMRGTLALVVGGSFAAGALFFAIMGFLALIAFIGNRRILVEIGDKGIQHGNRFTPWAEVKEFRGTRYANGVCLGFTPTRRPFVSGDGNLPTTPLLSEQEYVELAQKLLERVVVQHANLSVVMLPIDA